MYLRSILKHARSVLGHELVEGMDNNRGIIPSDMPIEMTMAMTMHINEWYKGASAEKGYFPRFL